MFSWEVGGVGSSLFTIRFDCNKEIVIEIPGTCYLQFDSGATIPNLGGSQVADRERLLDIGVSCESSPGPTGGGLTMNEVG